MRVLRCKMLAFVPSSPGVTVAEGSWRWVVQYMHMSDEELRRLEARHTSRGFGD